MYSFIHPPTHLSWPYWLYFYCFFSFENLTLMTTICCVLVPFKTSLLLSNAIEADHQNSCLFKTMAIFYQLYRF